MRYNTEKNKIQSIADCLTCSKFDKKLKKCNGFNDICYAYDSTTNTLIDGLTGLPIKSIKGEEK